MKNPFSLEIIVVVFVCLASVGLTWKITANHASIIAEHAEAIAENREAIESHMKKIVEQGEATQGHEQRLNSLEVGGKGADADSSRKLQADQPFTKDANKNWATTDNGALVIFGKGIVFGKLNDDCTYGNNVLSVDATEQNCPSGDGSVTFDGLM